MTIICVLLYNMQKSFTRLSTIDEMEGQYSQLGGDYLGQNDSDSNYTVESSSNANPRKFLDRVKTRVKNIEKQQSDKAKELEALLE
ncbi:hypothetical protein ACFL96_16130 [Thermoproteota archaeon]